MVSIVTRETVSLDKECGTYFALADHIILRGKLKLVIFPDIICTHLLKNKGLVWKGFEKYCFDLLSEQCFLKVFPKYFVKFIAYNFCQKVQNGDTGMSGAE
jgi:hypothetical protein